MTAAVDPLETEIQRYVLSGYRVAVRSDVSAQLIRPKTFNFWAALFLGFIFYLPFYMAKKDDVVYLTVGPDGQLTRVEPLVKGGRCQSCGYENVRQRTYCKKCHEPLGSDRSA